MWLVILTGRAEAQKSLPAIYAEHAEDREEIITVSLPGALWGASIAVVIPTGQYDPRRLINIGSNRWSFKPEVGWSKPYGRWTIELVGGVWLFTANSAVATVNPTC